MKSGIFRILMLALLLSSCAGPNQAANVQSAGEQASAQPGAAGSEAGQGKAIGTIQLVHKSILHNDNEVLQIDDVFENDALYVKGGGEGILEVADKLRMRIFNTTRLGGITIKEAPGSPLAIRIFLERGGFTGQFAALEGETDYETPGGAVIRIKGTTFLVVYDPDSGVTTAGNFGGSVTIESGGSGPLEVAAGMMRQADSGEPPGQQVPLTYNQDQYEQRARDLQDPVVALESLGQMAGQPQVETQPPPPAQDETEPPPPPPGQTQPPLQPAAPLGPPTATTIIGSHCREGTSKVFEAVRDFNAGTQLTVDGRLADSSWWRVKVPGSSKSCWIYSQQISLSGDLESVPVLAPPPTPTPLPPTDTPTQEPSETPTPTEIIYVPDVPTAPDLYSPAYNDTLYCGTSSSGSIDLSWSAASDQDGISYYELFVEDADYGITYFSDKVFGTTTSVSLDCAPSPGIHYHWIVRAVDTTGTPGPWSGDGYFYAVQVIG